jgi:cellulose synthase/poly-beta-1,6-N-acetylglucosamine synthase-like glycosyltransferase
MTAPFFTIIIPVKAINDYIRETVSYILRLADSNWELIVIPNDVSPSEWFDPRIRIMSSGRVGPGVKRDLGAKEAKGELLVFLDDDSYPDKDLLTQARPLFNDPAIAAVGGPAITPPEDGFWQKVSGAVFLSRFSGGIPERYIPVGRIKEVNDWPSVNLMVRKRDFLAAGGFDSNYWPGEDTKLCLQIVKNGKKIIYNPKMVVWHHRRSGFFAHLKQVGGYGLHRGFFAKRFPETSFKIGYFIPSFFVLFSMVSLFGLFLSYPGKINALLTAAWCVYGLALCKAFVDFVKYVSPLIAVNALFYTVMTHLVYGAQFIRGFVFTRNLVSRLR